MKISQIMEYMKIECIIKGDVQYSEDLVFDDLSIEILDDSVVTNEEFHQKAKLCETELNILNYSNALQNHIDAKAREKSYSNGWACATYANSNNEVWQNEALKFIAWRDSAWEYALEVQNNVEQGEEAPTIDEFLAGVPDFNWD